MIVYKTVNAKIKSSTVGWIVLGTLFLWIFLGIVLGINIGLLAYKPHGPVAAIEMYEPHPWHPSQAYKELRICWTNAITKTGGHGEWISRTNVFGWDFGEKNARLAGSDAREYFEFR